MSETINLPKLISRLSAMTQTDPAQVRRFLHQMFANVEQMLAQGDSVTIKGVGEFSPGIDASRPVLFLADEQLNRIANEPFSVFSAVELNEGVDETTLSELDVTDSEPESEYEVESSVESSEPESEIVQNVPESEPIAEHEPGPDAEPEVEPEVESEPGPESVAESEIEAAPASKAAPEPELFEPEPEYEDEAEPVYDQPRVETGKGHVLWFVIGALTGLLLGLVGGFFAGKWMSRYDTMPEIMPSDTLSVDVADEYAATEPSVNDIDRQEEAVSVTEETEVVNPETPVAAPAQPQPTYDTTTKSRFLTTMARDHYGKKNYWVFIYQANPSLGNPNIIKPGTRVVIPPAESFMCGTQAETDAKARALLNELSRKYKL